MRYRLRHRTVPFRMSALALLCAATLGGCVSADTHKKALAELDAAKKLTAQQQLQLTGMRESLDLEAAFQHVIAEEIRGRLIEGDEAWYFQREAGLVVSGFDLPALDHDLSGSRRADQPNCR